VEDALDPRQGATNLTDRFDSIHFGHGNVRHDDIRAQLASRAIAPDNVDDIEVLLKQFVPIRAHMPIIICE
jgi:hypothetical protein